ncbi:MAG: DUF1015 domain-containing protein [Gemmatimonadaceae bacterium]|nr:DUF1015 domain-containing protein [Chitinophagaceae bacterium]
MAIIQPFKALRPKAELAAKVASPPYDVLNSAEARELVKDNPYSFLHVTKSEVDLPEGIDIHGEQVYQKAKDNLDAFIRKEILFRETKPCFYIYQLVMNGRTQTGLVAVSSISDYENDIIKKHEFTRPEKEQDRINHIRNSGAQTGNVFLAYKSVDAIDALIENWKASHRPIYDFISEDAIGHSIWVINDEKKVAEISALFVSDVPFTYIADGHHRAASAAKVKSTLGKAATADSEYFLTTLFPSAQLKIMDYNRVVKDLNGLGEPEFLRALYDNFDVERIGTSFSPTSLHEFGMYLGGMWYKLIAKKGTYSEDPIGVLDVTILSNLVLDKILGIKDQRTDKRIDFVGGIRGLLELEKRVNSGEMKVAFSLHPVTIQQLFDIADSGNVMPPKSTWFEPKLRDGLLTNMIV